MVAIVSGAAMQVFVGEACQRGERLVSKMG